MTKKVLIISSPYFNFQNNIANAFEELGYSVHIETYDEPIHPFKGLLRWRHKFAVNKERLRAKSRAKYDIYIKDIFDNYRPDLVFIYNGSILLDQRLDYFRETSKVIIWMYDSVLRKGNERCKEHIHHADKVFCFEKKDVEYYKSIGKEAIFLPSCCDTRVHYPNNSSERDIDILFVGVIYTSKKRQEYLDYLIAQFQDRKIVIYGEQIPFVKFPLKCLLRRNRKIYKNHNIPPYMVNQLFNRTKVALNIHNEQSTDGANPRVFETCAAGAYQVCDANPYIESLFQHGEVGLYHSKEEMVEKIQYALEHNMEAQAKAGYELITSNHTFLTRVKYMLSFIEQ